MMTNCDAANAAPDIHAETGTSAQPSNACEVASTTLTSKSGKIRTAMRVRATIRARFETPFAVASTTKYKTNGEQVHNSAVNAPPAILPLTGSNPHQASGSPSPMPVHQIPSSSEAASEPR
jgi:hypothetical protein